MHKLKRAVAINDISGFGKCSLTVALPILSATGVETVAMPTAVLSTHTGGLDGYTYLELTDQMQPMADHWKSLGIEFDAIYSGYLGSLEQLDIVSGFIDDFKADSTTVLIDPVMADNGKMYKHFDEAYAAKMAMLCKKADIIVPNFTEAAFMLGEEYREAPYDRAYVEGLASRLAAETDAGIVLTGVDMGDGKLGAFVRDREGTGGYAFAEKINGYYHGTGDVFASVLLGAYLNGRTLVTAAKIAADFTAECIARTLSEGTDHRFGVNFENGLPKLLKELARK